VRHFREFLLSFDDIDNMHWDVVDALCAVQGVRWCPPEPGRLEYLRVKDAYCTASCGDDAVGLDLRIGLRMYRRWCAKNRLRARNRKS